MSGHPVLIGAEKRLSSTLETLRTLVQFESPSNEKVHVDDLVDYLEAELENRCADRVERVAQKLYGDLLIGRFDGTAEPPILVLTHIDTVWPVGTLERIPFRIEDDKIFGPGVYDMKASVAMMLTALDLLNDRKSRNRTIIWLINTEEEVGSPISRSVIEELAQNSEVVMCLEPPVPPMNSLKTERKGVGMFEMEILGRSAHAGADHQAGVSAIEELAKQIQWLHSLTDYDAGTTVNVGVVSGGTKRNVIAANAEALIDLRVASVAEAERIVPTILEAQPLTPGATVRVRGGLNRPPMERGDHIVRAFEQAKQIGSEIGQSVTEAATGGGSDGNFTAALGIPTIDGLGCPGNGAHADSEHVHVGEISARTALITALLENL